MKQYYPLFKLLGLITILVGCGGGSSNDKAIIEKALIALDNDLKSYSGTVKPMLVDLPDSHKEEVNKLFNDYVKLETERHSFIDTESNYDESIRNGELKIIQNKGRWAEKYLSEMARSVSDSKESRKRVQDEIAKLKPQVLALRAKIKAYYK